MELTCGGLPTNRALSWSHDAWALIALISAILVLGLLWKYMGLCSVLVLLIRITRAPRAQVNIIFLQMLVMHVLDHNNIYLNDTLK